MLTEPIQPGAHYLHGDAAIVAVGHVEDVAGEQLDGLDLAHGTDARPAMAPMSSNTRRPPDRNGKNFQNDRISSVAIVRVQNPVWLTV